MCDLYCSEREKLSVIYIYNQRPKINCPEKASLKPKTDNIVMTFLLISLYLQNRTHHFRAILDKSKVSEFKVF